MTGDEAQGSTDEEREAASTQFAVKEGIQIYPDI